MTKFLLRLGVFLTISTAMVYGLDELVSGGLRNLKTGEFGTWSDLYHGRIDADLVIVGSSRAMVHVSPAILSQQLGMSVYNLGNNGQHFPIQRIRFEEYRKFNRKPKWIIQTVDITSLHDRRTAFQYEQFLPWFDHADLVDTISRYEGYQAMDYWIPMYRYRGRGELVTQGISLALGIRTSSYDRDRGYIGRDFAWDETYDNFERTHKSGFVVPVEQTIEFSIEAFLHKQAVAGTTVIMVFTPEYLPAQHLCLNRDNVVSRLKRIAARNRTLFIDYSSDSICKDQSMFYNSQHLNRMGAERFSQDLAKRLIVLQSGFKNPGRSVSPSWTQSPQQDAF
ncbi:MAG: hypothetical protein R3C49_23710 [Planctomycetaceae bacterium]